jgi:hypothetical protein
MRRRAFPPGDRAHARSGRGHGAASGWRSPPCRPPGGVPASDPAPRPVRAGRGAPFRLYNRAAAGQGATPPREGGVPHTSETTAASPTDLGPRGRRDKPANDHGHARSTRLRGTSFWPGSRARPVRARPQAPFRLNDRGHSVPRAAAGRLSAPRSRPSGDRALPQGVFPARDCGRARRAAAGGVFRPASQACPAPGGRSGPGLNPRPRRRAPLAG